MVHERTHALGPAGAMVMALAAFVLAPSGGVAQLADPEPSEVDAVFQEWDDEGLPGCAVGVMHEGELIYAQGYGMANLDWGIPIDPSTVFYIGSISKQFAAAAVALLHMEGVVSLDDDVRRHIPELPDYGETVTLRHLIHHTSGIRDTYALLNLAGLRVADAHDDDEYLELIAGQGSLNFPPGEEYLYSNGAYYLLSETVRRATGRSLGAFTEERFFQPLGMESTHFHEDRERIVPRRAMSYGGSSEEGFRQTYLGNFDKVGAGGLYSSIEDFVAWERNFLTDEIGEGGLMELLLTRGELNSGETLDYAFALSHGEHRGLPTVGHGGSFMGFRADYVRFPEERFAVAVFCNLGSINPGGPAREVAELYLEPLMEPEPDDETDPTSDDPNEDESEPVAELSPEVLPEYAGDFRNRDLGVTYRVRLQGDTLRMERPRATPQVLEWEEGDRFRAGGWEVEFLRAPDGEVRALSVDAGRARGVHFIRVSSP